ncbi:Inner membrane protein YhaH [Flavobacterium sp. ACN2]|jgi:uncharacterized membrane protein YhaH (DUF805 family)|uniref:DUF805 domain-containing protein n=1 Tax=Flavobacterium sp. ACN2 TaxID=1975676 RepID=UPI000BB3489B|nr:DUF805 domain-containing protein [Flavobacterium sp. ACN2]PBI87590.1 Inner membrane protein YhaH [Flavobacterium sp. ACN2]
MLEMYKKVVLENYTNFDGRARRKEYWMFFLVSTIISVVLNVIDATTGLTFGPGKTGILGLIYSLLVLIPSLAVAVRRMHDVAKSGWYVLIPIYNLILACTEGEKGSNQYGADPKNQLEEINEIGKE